MLLNENTRLYILGCKIGCLFCKTLIFNVYCGAAVLTDDNGRQQRASLEVDFVCNMGSRRYYIQSTYRIESDEKMRQEQASLLKVNDSFKKIIVTGEEGPVTRDEAGVMTISIYDFLLKANSLEL